MSIIDEFNKFSQASEAEAERIIRGTAISLFGAIITDTPVISGRLRGNWQTSTGKPKTSQLNRDDKSGAAASSEAASVANGFKIADNLYLANNLIYAEVIENGNATHRPQGMVKRNVQAFNDEIKKRVKG